MVVAQDRDAVFGERRAHGFAAHQVVVVSKDRIPCLALQLRQDARALPRGAFGKLSGPEFAGDKVTGQYDHIRFELIDALHRFAEEVGLGELFHVDVRELCDAKAVEILREAGKAHFMMGCFEPVAVDFASVECRACCAAKSRFEECAS